MRILFIGSNEFFLKDICITDCEILQSSSFEIIEEDDIDLLVIDFDSFDEKIVGQIKKIMIPKIVLTSLKSEEFFKYDWDVATVDYLNSADLDKSILLNRLGIYQNIIDLKNQNKKTKDLLVKQSKAIAMSEMIGALAHQWRQPLNTIATSMITVETKAELGILDFDEVQRISNKINSSLQVISTSIDEFRKFLTIQDIKKTFNMVAMLQEIIKIINTQFSEYNIKVDFYAQENEILIDGYPNEFKHAILNIIMNAKDAIELKRETNGNLIGNITIDLANVDDKHIITISDNGGGISDDIIDKIYDFGFTTKSADQGTGLGLYMTKLIIEQGHNGKIEFENDDGAKFKIAV